MTAHAIVIGTGAGGLAAASQLAKDGFDVLALEHAQQLGGYLAPFEREGFHFDVGVHYLGQGRRGQMMHELLTSLGVDPDALLVELDEDAFDVYRFPDFEIGYCRGLDRFRDRMIERFPDDADGLRRFFRLAERTNEVMRMLSGSHRFRLEDLRTVPKMASLLRWIRRSYGDLLRAYVHDPRARAVLAGLCGDYGLAPSRAAATIGLGVFAYYGDGGFYPRGGSAGLRDALVFAAERRGVRFRTGAHVEKILVRDGRAVGVELAGGERLDADVVVSNADPVTTFGRMLDRSVLPRALLDRVAQTEPSLATFAVYLGMRRDLSAHGLRRGNVWSYGDWDLERVYAEIENGRLPEHPMLFLSPSSLKEGSGGNAPPGCSTLEIVTFVPYSLFEPWKDRAPTQRGEAYEAEKRRVADWLLAAVDARHPGLVGDVVVREVSTPLTNESYVCAVRGGAYGPAQTARQSGPWRFRTTTPLPNLFLAGAGVLGGGVPTCLASGKAAAAAASRAATRRRAAA